MNRIITLVALATLISISASATPLVNYPKHCNVAGDIVSCFAEPFIVDAYSDIVVAEANFRGLPPTGVGSPKWMLSTADPTRRALVIHEWDYSTGPNPNSSIGGYVAEFYPTGLGNVDDDVTARWRSLDDEQRATGFRLEVGRDFRGGGVLLVYRRFAVATNCNVEVINATH